MLTDEFDKCTPNVLAKLFVDQCKDNGIQPSMLGHEGFKYPLAISVNNCVAHGFPSSGDAKFKRGDVIKIDASGFNGRYHSDMAHTVCMHPSTKNRDDLLIKATATALQSAISACKPGVPYSTIPSILGKVAKDNGVCSVRSLTGHGIGEELHMLPTNHSDEIMRAGDVFTIEPIFALGSEAVFADAQGAYWTQDSKNAAHFERTILITEGSHIVLNTCTI
jgi:methionyl aminopeptidase